MSALAVDRQTRFAVKERICKPTIFTVAVRACTDTEGYYAICDTPDGGCVTQARTLQEIQKNMIEAMEFHFEDSLHELNYLLRFEVHHAENPGH